MKKKNYSHIRITVWLAAVLFIGTLFFSFPLHGVEIMKVSEIKSGMKGTGKTIFKGTQIETFPFTVLGILQNYAPGKSLIIFEADCPELNDAGISEGMSGSPAYIDGKLIGAIAIGFNYSKKPIGGITPIEDIIKTSDFNVKNPAVDISNIKMDFDKKSLSSLSDRLQKELSQRIQFNPVNSIANSSPIRLVGLSRGLNPAGLSCFSSMLAQGSNLKLSTETNPLLKKPGDSRIFSLSPADAVSVVLISGDLEYSALGTVTHVDGDKVYMFGHPFYNLGSIDFPMYKADIITVVPNFLSSFKLGATRNMVGRAVQDRFSAVQGELGKVPYMIPVKISLKNRNRTYNFEIVNHTLLTPLLTSYSIASIFSSEFQELGFQSLEVDGKIFIEGEKNITIKDLYSGSQSYIDFSNLLLAVNFFLLNNKEKTIKIQKIDFEITVSETVRIANIENVLVDKNSYSPGEVINTVVYLKNEKGESFKEDYTLTTPNLKPGSEFFLLVADAEEMSKFDAKNVHSTYVPDKLSFLIRAVNNLRKNNCLYMKVMTAEEGLFVKGFEYPKIPDSLQSMFMYDKSPIFESASESQSPVRYTTVYEYQSPVSSVVKGSKLIKLKIKERSDVK